jgi:hypothetical protein
MTMNSFSPSYQRYSSGRVDAERILDTIFNEMTLIAAVDEQGLESRYPNNRHEIEIIRAGLAKLDQMPSLDNDLVERREQWRRVAREAGKRSFSGSWWLIVLSFLILGGLAWMRFHTAQKPLANVELAPAWQEYSIKKMKDSLQQEQILSNSGYALERANKKMIIEREKASLARMQQMTPQEFFDSYNAKAYKELKQAIPYAVGAFLLPLLYFFSARPPRYLAFRRRNWMGKLRTFGGIAGKILVGMMGTVFAMRVIESTTYWSDGTMTKDSNAGDVLTSQAAVVAIMLAVLAVFVMRVMPVLVCVNFLLNYSPELLERALPKKPMPAF